MSWKVIYSENARQDLRDIFQYISSELSAPTPAKNKTRVIIQSIKKLNEMPMRFHLYKEEPWHSAGLRYFPIDNYLVFYLPKEDDETVYIVRIMYGGRNVKNMLNEIIK